MVTLKSQQSLVVGSLSNNRLKKPFINCKFPSNVNLLSWSSNSQRLLASCEGGKVYIFDIAFVDEPVERAPEIRGDISSCLQRFTSCLGWLCRKTICRCCSKVERVQPEA